VEPEDGTGASGTVTVVNPGEGARLDEAFSASDPGETAIDDIWTTTGACEVTATLHQSRTVREKSVC